MVFSLVLPKRRRKLAEEAARSRASAVQRSAAWLLVIVYNCVGLADIVSTVTALDAGTGVEANPILNMLMSHAGEGWILAKLALQGLISFMVLWFPHRIVLAFFIAAVTGNAWVVWNNFTIAGVF